MPPNPGNVSAFGLLTVDVKNDYVRTHVAVADGLDPAVVAATYDDLTAQARGALLAEGFTEAEHRFDRTADLRYVGQAFEVRVPVSGGDLDPAAVAAVSERFHAEHRALYGYDFAGDASQPVEWVNLRVSGIGPITRPTIARHSADDPHRSAPRDLGSRLVCFEPADGFVETPILWRDDLVPGRRSPGRPSSRSSARPCPLHPGFVARVDDHLNLIVTRETQR